MHVPSLVGQLLPNTSRHFFSFAAVFIKSGNILFGSPFGASPIRPEGCAPID